MSADSRYIVALLFIGAGVGIALDVAGYWDFGHVIGTWWPLILVVVGLVHLVTRSAPWPFAVILILVGSILLAVRQGWIPGGGARYIWPGILILIGLLILFRPSRRRHYRHVARVKDPRHPRGAATDVTTDTLHQTVLLSGFHGRVRGAPFRGGSVAAILGGIRLDLRDARLPAEGADLEATALMGSVDIRVPESWHVEVNATPILGVVENKARTPPVPGAPTLRIGGTAILGGITIQAP